MIVRSFIFLISYSLVSSVFAAVPRVLLPGDEVLMANAVFEALNEGRDSSRPRILLVGDSIVDEYIEKKQREEKRRETPRCLICSCRNIITYTTLVVWVCGQLLQFIEQVDSTVVRRFSPAAFYDRLSSLSGAPFRRVCRRRPCRIF